MTLNCNGKILDFSTKKIMGIVNISKDSFFDGGEYDNIEKVNSQVSKLISNGADIIDLGAASSKPGSKLIGPKEEFDLIYNHINELASNFRDRGMGAYSELQQAEFNSEKNGYTATRHQREVGTGYFDMVSEAAAGGESSTTALSDSTEADQF